MRRATVCFSMYSDMSMRTMALVVVEEELGQGLGELRLADTRGAQEDEAADGAVGVLQAGPGAAHGVGHGHHGVVLADDALVEVVLHEQEALLLALLELVDRNARPARLRPWRCPRR